MTIDGGIAIPDRMPISLCARHCVPFMRGVEALTVATGWYADCVPKDMPSAIGAWRA